MTLQRSDLQALQKPFAFADHEFTRGFCYLTEESVTRRLDEVDPSWEFEILETGSNREKQVYVNARLTVKGVSRCNTGMQDVNDKAGEAEKGAATDALKRCARLFGVGRYILGAPKEGPEFKAWLAAEQRKAGLAEKGNAGISEAGKKVDTSAAKALGAAVLELQENSIPEGFTRYRLESVAVNPRGDGRHQYLLGCEGPEKQSTTIVLYSADVFRKAGFEDARIDGWKTAKKVNLSADQHVYIVAQQVPNGKGNPTWNVARVEVNTLGETHSPALGQRDQRAFEALGKQTA